MGTRKRMARRFRLEALEGRLAPGGAHGLGGEVLQAHVASRQADVAPPGGGTIARPESVAVACGLNSMRCGQETNATAVVDGSKPGGAGDG